jgi:hypothetical protein
MASSDYLQRVGANRARLGDQAYASACVKTILAAHTTDEANFPEFSGVVAAAQAALPKDHPVRTALEAPDADVNWASHVAIMNQFGDMGPAGVAAELKCAPHMRVSRDASLVYPIALAERILTADQSGVYEQAVGTALQV